MFRRVGLGAGLAIAAIMCVPSGPARAEGKPMQLAYAVVGDETRAPIGWMQFCQDYRSECASSATEARDVVLTQSAWRDLVRVNRWANESIKPMTDQEHWGVVEKWDLPTDGYGDCEDYVLLKRKTLIDAGWPRQSLLITVVRDKNGDGHAVLTVKTDKGEFVLDNQNENILPWSQTGYRFVKRQSQLDQNVWVSLSVTPQAPATASAR